MTDLGLPLKIRSEDDLLYTVDTYPMTFENIRHLWDRFSRHRVLIADFAHEDPRAFFAMILTKSTIVLKVDDIGIIYLTEVVPGYTAIGHYFFWDRVSQGRHKLLLHVLKWCMDSFDLHRVSLDIPRHAYAALHRTYKIGCRLEGVTRETVLHKGKWHDMFHFGILESELTDTALETGYIERVGDERGWFGLLKRDTDLMNYIMEKV